MVLYFHLPKRTSHSCRSSYNCFSDMHWLLPTSKKCWVDSSLKPLFHKGMKSGEFLYREFKIEVFILIKTHGLVYNHGRKQENLSNSLTWSYPLWQLFFLSLGICVKQTNDMECCSACRVWSCHRCMLECDFKNTKNSGGSPPKLFISPITPAANTIKLIPE